jgi:hypothetical protein
MNYQAKVREYVLSQLRDVVGFKQTLQAIADTYEALDDKLQAIYKWQNIDEATGVILDYIGYLYGITREYFDIEQYFCVNAEHVNVEKYFFFENPQSNFLVPNGSLDDLHFRQRIKAKIASTFSKKTRNENINIIKNMTFADIVEISLNSAMNLDIHLIGANIFETDKTFSEIESILGDGVAINSLTIN